MQNPNPKDRDDQNHHDLKPQNHPHFQVLNKTKSTINPSNLFLNLNSPQARSGPKKEILQPNNKKEISLTSPNLSQQKKNVPIIYQVCEGDTLESIAAKFNISKNWLIRQNLKQTINPDFSLSKGMQLNVTSPSNSMIKPLNCSLVRGESHSDEEGSLFDNEIGENGLSYIIICENSFDFVPFNFNSTHVPLHIKLTSLDDNVIIFTPKSQREKLQKPKNIENSTENTTQVPSTLNDPLAQNLNESTNSPEVNLESMKIEKTEEKSNKNDEQMEQHHTIIKKQEESSNQNENISDASQQNSEAKTDLNENTYQETQAHNSDTIIENDASEATQYSNKDQSNNQQPQNSDGLSSSTGNIQQQQQSAGIQNPVENSQDQISTEKSSELLSQIQADSSITQSSNNENKSTYVDKIDLLLQENENDEDSPIIPKSQTDPSKDKDSVLVITYKTNPKDPNSIDSLYFRVQKEEGNSFSAHLQKAIKEAKLRAKNRKKPQIPAPKSPPTSISGSQSSPLNFFQSIFSSIKETFSHLGEEPSTSASNNDNNNENDNKASGAPKQNRSNLYRRSFSEKTISGSFGNPFLDNPAPKNKDRIGSIDDALKPRRNSESVSIPASKQSNRKVLSASVLLQIKIIDGPSAIFERQEEIDEIRAKLPYRMRSYDWMLIYRLSRDGSSFTNFFNYTRNSGPIVFIMSTSTNERIGAFIPTGFKYSTKYYGSGEAFVFRLVKENKKKTEKVNEDKNEENNQDKNNEDKNEENNQEESNENKNTENNQDENNEDNNEEHNKADNNNNNDIEDINQSENKIEEEINDIVNQSESNENDNKKDIEKNTDDKKNDDSNDSSSFAHLEAFKWTPGTNSNFMMSEKDTIIIGIGNDKDSYDQKDIDTINSSNGSLPGPAIWIGEDLQYASSSPCNTFSSPQLTKKNYFYVDDIEIWKIGFFSNK